MKFYLFSVIRSFFTTLFTFVFSISLFSSANASSYTSKNSFVNSFLNSDEKIYKVVPNSNGFTGINFSIGYSTGTHEGSALETSGSAKISLNPLTILEAEVSVPLSKVNTGNAKRDCHLRESLGLDYAKTSKNYPENHVCSSGNTLPETGGDSVVYPFIKFSFVSLSVKKEDSLNLQLGAKTTLLTNGVFELHGVKKNMSIPLTYSMNEKKQLIIEGNFDVLLSDFEVIVKPFLFIKVKDTAQVSLSLTLEEVL